MNNNICSDRSRMLLKDYAENVNVARFLTDQQIICNEFINVLDVMESMRQNWNAEKLRADALQEKISTREIGYSELLQENRIYKEQLRDARAQIASLMSDKQNLERDIAEMEKKFALVSQLLKNDRSLLNEEDQRKLAFLNDKAVFHAPKKPERRTQNVIRSVSPTLSRSDDTDYDRTADSVDISYDDSDESHLRNGKVYRRSQSFAALSGARQVIAAIKRPKESTRICMVEEEMGTPCKRSKDGTETIITTTTTITLDAEGKKPTKANVSIRRSRNRSMSESNILCQKDVATESTTQFESITPRFGASTFDLRTPCSAVKTWTNGASIETRPHTFVNFTSLLGDHCEVCNRWIGLTGKAAYKCADCGIRVHKMCARSAPVPCVPRTPTPRTPGKQRPRLKDFCPSTQPMIPSLIIHCVLALEKDRLITEGIYRIPGQESQVVKLLNDFKNGRSLPKLELHDTETITGCIKRFLRELRDPVIPALSWEEFVSAAESEDFESLNRSVMDLPYPNRDTLAFLCAHFQRVCENSAWNKMTPEVLARSIAPTVVGRAPPHAVTMAQSADEVAKQIMVFMTLLKMPRDYWPKFYEFDQGRPLLKSVKSQDTETFAGKDERTPLRASVQVSGRKCRKDPNKAMLGPVETLPSVGQVLSNKHGKFAERY